MGEFSLLSLNTFGVPLYMGWNRLSRLASQLDRSPAMLICLQEVQQHAYLPLIQRGLTSYPHAISERHVYAPKGGLAIFSRLPVIQHRFEAFQDMGTWHSLSFPDWATHKGILSVHLEIDGLEVIVLNTHLNANYSGVWRRTNPSGANRAAPGAAIAPGNLRAPRRSPDHRVWRLQLSQALFLI